MTANLYFWHLTNLDKVLLCLRHGHPNSVDVDVCYFKPSLCKLFKLFLKADYDFSSIHFWIQLSK